MSKYSRVSYEERCQIFILLQAKLSILEISKLLNRSKSTIYRELYRQRSNNGYCPNRAQQDFLKKSKFRKKKNIIRGETKKIIIKKLKESWGPELISGRLRMERKSSISFQCIYSYIKKHKVLKSHLRFGSKIGFGRRVQKRLRMERYLSIRDRPKSVEKRKNEGHWERDGMYGGNLEQILVCLERKSRFVRLGIPNGRSSKDFNDLTIKLLKNERVLSITNDNGSEFRKKLDYKNVPVYYCDPLRPDQRGSVENVIGTMRMFIKRNTDLKKLGKRGIKRIEKLINTRPRKIFNYKTPYEMHYRKKVALVS